AGGGRTQHRWPKPDRRRTSSGEGGELLRRDSALWSDDQDHIPGRRRRHPRQRLARLFVQDQGGRRGADPLRHRIRGSQRRHDRQPCAASLLGRFPSGGDPALVGSLAPAFAPPDDRPSGRPRNDLVDPNLGHGLNRELAAVALCEGLDDDEPGARLLLVPAPAEAELDHPPANLGDHPLGERAEAVAHQYALADPQPRHRRSVMPLRPGQRALVALWQRIDEKQRRAHTAILPVAHAAARQPRYRTRSSIAQVPTGGRAGPSTAMYRLTSGRERMLTYPSPSITSTASLAWSGSN